MDGLALLREAESAGLKVHAEGDKLVVRGPKSAEPIALRLIEFKTAVLPLVAGGAQEHAITNWLRDHPPESGDTNVCGACGALLSGGGVPLAIKIKDARPDDPLGRIWVCGSVCVERYYQKRRTEAEAALEMQSSA